MRELDVFGKCDKEWYKPDDCSFCNGSMWSDWGLKKLKYLTYFYFLYSNSEDNIDPTIFIKIFRTSDKLFRKNLACQRAFHDCGYLYSFETEIQKDDRFVLVISKSGKYGAYELTQEEYTEILGKITKVFKEHMSEDHPEGELKRENFNIYFITDAKEKHDMVGWNLMKIGSQFINGLNQIIGNFPMREIYPHPSANDEVPSDYGDDALRDLDLPKFLRRV